MARPRSTPSTPSTPEGEPATPLQKLLVGSLLWALILVPLFGFVFYVSPIYKAFPTIYRGDFFMLGVGLALVFSVAISFVWMTFVPRMLERRELRRKRADEARRAERKALAKRAREEE
jgi:membrane protein implicated in regulation of membrane protease activity